MTPTEISHFELPGRKMAVRRRLGTSPSLLFLPGYASDMEGAKAVAIDSFAAKHGIGCVRLDYSGTGASDGDFADGTLERWTDEALTALDQLCDGPAIVIGSSMGGWIGLHLALRRPERVKALVGIAAAPDFTDWGFSEPAKQRIIAEGLLEEDNPYGPEPSRFYCGFWESGQVMRLLGNKIGVTCPVRLVHGEQDEDVPIAIVHRLMAALRSADVQLLTIKGGGHRLSEPHEIEAILRTIAGLLETPQ